MTIIAIMCLFKTALKAFLSCTALSFVGKSAGRLPRWMYRKRNNSCRKLDGSSS